MFYVDNLRKMPRARGKCGELIRWGTFCHLTADSFEELRHVAKKLGLQHHWLQRSFDRPHYDLSPKKRALAIRLGAVEVKRKEFLLKAIKAIRKEKDDG